MGNEFHFLHNRALARRVIRHYTDKGVLVRVGDPHHAQFIYTVSESALASQKKETAAQPQAASKGEVLSFTSCHHSVF